MNRRHTVFLFTSVSLCVCVLLLAATTALMADQQESQSASAGAVRNWSDLGLETVSGAPYDGCEIPLLCEIPPKELERLKAQPYVPPADAGMVQLDMDTSVLGLEPQPLLPTVVSGFEARDNASQPSGFRHRPPDPHLAVGPSHIVEMVNTTLVVYNKSGTKLKETSFKSWWGNVYTGSSNPFDPRVAYDHNEHRWLMVTLVRETTTPTLSKYLLSISQTPDPTGAWWNWSLEGKLSVSGTDGWADYEDIGFDGIPSSSGGAIYLTSNQFTFSANAFQTSAILILPKSSLYAGSAFDYWRAWDRTNSSGSQAATLRTAQTFGNPGVEYLVNSSSSTNFVTLWSVTPTFPPTAVNITRQATVTIGSYSVPPNATQLGCGSTLDTIGNRIYNAMYRNNALYCAFCEGFNWGSGTVAAVRYLKINTATNAADIDTRWGSDGFHYWMPAIYTDRFGNIVLVFARSGATEYAGLWAGVRMAGSSVMQTLPQLKGGEQCITGSRWGDYFGAVLDPSDTSLVWVCGQYAKVITGGDSTWDWGTWISSIRQQELTNRRDLIVDFGNFSAGINAYYNNTTPWTSRHHWGPGAYNMVMGDLDGNGQQDLIVDFGFPQGINVLHNNGPFSSWVRIHNFSPGPGRMVVGDLDGNGQQDLIVDFGNFNAGINVYYNNSGPWTSIHSFGPGQGRMVVGDMDGNGKDDLIVDFGPPFNAGINVYYNNAAPWTSIHPFNPGMGRMVTGDLDGNGKADLIVDFGNFFAGINVYYNNSTPWTSVHPYGPGAYKMVTGDMDGNGKADLIVDFGDFNAGINVYYNNAAPWTSRHHWGPGSGRMAVADLDGDGRADLIADFGQNQGINVLHNNGPFTSWTRIHNFSPGEGRMVTGNMDGN